MPDSPDLDSHDPLVRLEGALNFRDLGGYPAGDGRKVCTGQVYRADGLGGLCDADLDRLRELRLRTVIDFRRDDERESAPTVVWDHGLELLHLGVGEAGDERGDLMQQLLSGRLGADPVPEMAGIYADILRDYPDRFRLLLEHLSRPERRPAVFHCTAGKDRTGLAAMLVLGILGVPDEVVVFDYALTHRYRTTRRLPVLEPVLAEAGIPIESALPFVGAVPEVMAATLDRLHTEYGGAEGYALGYAGVPASVVEDLRAGLVC